MWWQPDFTSNQRINDLLVGKWSKVILKSSYLKICFLKKPLQIPSINQTFLSHSTLHILQAMHGPHKLAQVEKEPPSHVHTSTTFRYRPLHSSFSIAGWWLYAFEHYSGDRTGNIHVYPFTLSTWSAPQKDLPSIHVGQHNNSDVLFKAMQQ